MENQYLSTVVGEFDAYISNMRNLNTSLMELGEDMTCFGKKNDTETQELIKDTVTYVIGAIGYVELIEEKIKEALGNE